MLIRGRYRLVKQLGEGAMGTVYEVSDELLGGVPAALKCLWPGPNGRALVESLRREFRTLATVRHPLLCQVYDFGQLPESAEFRGGSGPGFFLARELLAGDDLSSLRDKSETAVALAFAQAARGLDVLHRAGLRHGDFKPANALVCSGTVRLIDFGLSSREGGRRGGGTLAYCAPEVLDGRPIDRRADLYALGVSLFEILCGRLPSGDRSGHELIAWHQGGSRPLLVEQSSAGEELSHLVARLLNPDPNSRFPTAAESAIALERIAGAGTAPQTSISASGLIIEPLERAVTEAAEKIIRKRASGRGGPAIIDVVGGPGSGRSTLLTEIGWRAALDGVQVLSTRGVTSAAPLATMAAALDQIDSLKGSRARLAQEPRTFANIADDLVSTRLPIAIIVDDVDFADAGSLALIEFLAGALPHSAPVVILTSRIRGDSVLSTIHNRIELGSEDLTLGEVELLTQRASGRDDSDLAHRIHAHTGGNLLFVRATLEAIAADGFRSDEVSKVPVPRRLGDLGSAILANFSDNERGIADAIAVFGAAPTKTLAALSGVAGDAIDQIAQSSSPFELSRAGHVNFSHAAVRQTVLAALADGKRKQLHSLAQAILDERGIAVHSPRMLHHSIGAGERDRVQLHARAALDELAQRGDFVGAIELGRSALGLLETDQQTRVALRVRLAEVATSSGSHALVDEFVSVAMKALAGDPKGNDNAGSNDSNDVVDSLRGRAHLALARSLDSRGRPDVADVEFRLAQACETTRAAATRDLAYSLVRRGEASAAIEIARSADSSDPHIATAVAYARGSIGESNTALAELIEIADRAKESGDLSLEAAAGHLAGLTAYRVGDWKTTRSLQKRALEAASAAGDLARVGTLRMNLAAMDQSAGNWSSALEQGSQAVSVLDAAGAATYALMARRNLAQLLLDIGSFERAQEELEAARTMAAQLEMPVHRIGIDALLGLLFQRRGDWTAARAALRAAEADFRSLGDERRATETLLDLVELELDVGDVGAATEALDTASQSELAHNHPARNCRRLAARAHAAAATSDRVQAQEALAKLALAESRLSDHGATPARVKLHRRASVAEALLGNQSAASDRRERAFVLLTQLSRNLPTEMQIAFWQQPEHSEIRAHSLRVSEVDLSRSKSGSGASEILDAEQVQSAADSSSRIFRLLSIYKRLSEEDDPERLLTTALAEAVELAGADRGFLLLAKGSDPPRLVANHNLPKSDLDFIQVHESSPLTLLPGQLPYSRTVAEEVFRSGIAVLGNVQADARFAAAASVHSLQTPSIACVPACAGGVVVGALYLEGDATSLKTGPSDGRLLAAFGDQIAVLLRGAQRKQQLGDRASELASSRAEVEALLKERTRLLEERTDELSEAVREVSNLSRRLLSQNGAYGLVGTSAAMERVYELISRVGRSDVPVLIIGESGTGKELVARAIHMGSTRSDQAMVAVNCGAIPPTLLESELFGHVRGAFTGAARDRAGLFEMANRSTLFLDEISETPSRMQAALLRAIAESIVRRVGGNNDTEIDVRVVCASNRDLRELVERQEFRADLLYRLEVVTIKIPPLRERRGDIPLLCQHFLKRLGAKGGQAGLSVGSEALKLLFRYDWPGNVRQLEHALISASILGDGPILGVEAFADILGHQVPAAKRHVADEKQEILATLEAHGWNRSSAARALGMPRRTFYRRLEKYGIQ